MDKKVSKLLNKMGNDFNKNKKLTASRFFSVSEEVINSVINADCDVIKKLEFLTTLFTVKAEETYSFIFHNTRLSVSLISRLIHYNIELSDDVTYDINLYDKLISFCECLCNYRYNFSYEYFENRSTFQIIKKITNEVFLFADTQEDKNEIIEKFNSFKKRLYRINFAKYFVEKYIDLDNKLLKKEILNCFGDINYCDCDGTLLHWCSKTNVDEITMFKMTKKLLEVGVDPNVLRSNGDTFLYNLISSFQYRTDLLYEIIAEATKYGFNVNNEKDLLDILFRYIDISNELLNLLFDSGLEVTIDDVNGIKERTFKTVNIEQLELLTNYINNKEIVDSLINHLQNRTYTIEKDFLKNIYTNCSEFNTILNRIQCMVSTNTSTCFSDLWANTIIENRNNCVNNIGEEITISEALEALKTLANTSVKEINNDIDNQKNKIIVYKNSN